MYRAANLNYFNTRTRNLKDALFDMLSLITLVFAYIIEYGVRKLTFGKLKLSNFKFFTWITKLLDHKREGEISRIDLVEISVRNMAQKKARAMVTIGGMAIGIASIAFLVSIGYGLQEVVVSRVVRLDEMKQADVIPQVRGGVVLDDKSIESLKKTTGVAAVLPLIAAVGHVNFNASVSDVVVYGVTSEYLKTSAIKPSSGKLFENEETVAPSATPMPMSTAKPIAIKPTAVQKLDPNSDWVQLDLEEQTSDNIVTVPVASTSLKSAVVNKSFLGVLGLSEADAIGKKFEVSFVVVGGLLPKGVEKLQSVPTEYTIIGVTPDSKTPVMYVPFIDLRSLGVVQFSQVKLVAKDEKSLPTVRKQVEAMGFVTQSVADTVAQINSLFSTLRTVLLLLGMVALGVAALGMFNTLTVSLLERTREVGLMKVMGMRSSEIQELFFTQSIIMGIAGGVSGLLVGILLGKAVGVVLSLVTVSKGVGIIDVSYLPWTFLVLIIVVSLFVGILTGMYPARRATKISALNALRYE